MRKNVTHRRQRGQALIIIAGALIGLLALVALAVDGSNAFVQRRNAQNAADGASTAGTAKLRDFFISNRHCFESEPTRPCEEWPLTVAQNAQILSIIKSTLAANGADNRSMYDPLNPGTMDARYIDQDGHTYGNPVGSNDTVPLAGGNGPGSPGAAGVWVASTSQSPTYFARILGIDHVQADAHGAAQLGSPEAVAPPPRPPDASGNHAGPILWPLTILTGTINYNGGLTTLYNFDTQYGPGNWGDINYSDDGGTGTCAASVRKWQCHMLQGFDPSNPDSPFIGYEDVGGRTAGPQLSPMSTVPIGSDGHNPGSRGVWMDGDTGNRLSSSMDILDNAVRYHWIVFMPISDYTCCENGTNLKYHVVNIAAFRVESATGPGSRLAVTGRFVGFGWNSGNASWNKDLFKGVKTGQFVLRQGQQ